jgi:hypothetical protein
MITADIREYLRERLNDLPDVARRVYNRENIQARTTPLIVVVETVLYHFDSNNRQRVATLLGMTDPEMVSFLVGYVIGYGSGSRPSPSRGE